MAIFRVFKIFSFSEYCLFLPAAFFTESKSNLWCFRVSFVICFVNVRPKIGHLSPLCPTVALAKWPFFPHLQIVSILKYLFLSGFFFGIEKVNVVVELFFECFLYFKRPPQNRSALTILSYDI